MSSGKRRKLDKSNDFFTRATVSSNKKKAICNIIRMKTILTIKYNSYFRIYFYNGQYKVSRFRNYGHILYFYSGIKLDFVLGRVNCSKMIIKLYPQLKCTHILAQVCIQNI